MMSAVFLQTARHPEERRRCDMGSQFYMCEAHGYFEKRSYVNINEKILKNLLICPGSPRRAFGAPRDDGKWGRGFAPDKA
jgi:hypothetical protein